jgi:hypothetical protein
MFKHEDIKTGMDTVGVDKSYLERALKERGFSEFPMSGLDEGYLKPLMNEVFEMYAKESKLIPIKQRRKSLERKTGENKNEIKKRALQLREVVLGIGLGVTGLFLAFPTMKRILKDDGIGLWLPLLGGVLANRNVYNYLSQTNPKLIPYVIGTQIVTNIASGIYEQRRSVKNKAKEITETIKIREKCFEGNDCRRCDILNCPYCRPLEKPKEIEVEEEEYNNY